MENKRFASKIVIGTANFFSEYGVNKIKVTNQEIIKILNLAKKNNINNIDTAERYFNKKKINFGSEFKLISKIKSNYQWSSLTFCQKQIEYHYNKLNVKKIDTLLFHTSDILLKKVGKKIFKNIEILRDKNLFNKIGVSIYTPDSLDYLTKNYNFDVVQCPYNVFDKRIINSGWFKKLKKNKIEVHIRSIFLQGLLVDNLIFRKKYFKKWEILFFLWFDMLKKNNISAVDYCISDLLEYDFDRIIIGVNNYINLKEIINFKMINKKYRQNFEISDLKLIDPRYWM